MENIGQQLLNQIWNEGREIEMDDEEEREVNADGTLDGGVANDSSESNKSNRKTRSTDCDLTLFVACERALDIAPQHPILRPGTIVSIGLDKNTKLSAVFHRYVEFCNESSTKKDPKISVSDVEFFHSQLLNGGDTAESSALMKNDRMKVRKIRIVDREAESDRKRIQRDADRAFFQQMRHLMPDTGGSKTADIMLDCRGKLVDERGRNQQVLSSLVKAHSTLLRKRCPWLGAIIQTARVEAARQTAREADVLAARNASTPEGDENDQQEEHHANIVRRVESDAKSGDEDEDDGIAVLPVSPKQRVRETVASGAAEIENDDDEEDTGVANIDDSSPRKAPDLPRPNSPAIVPAEGHHNGHKTLLKVALPAYSPEAVKLLLEYCYTNRVSCLGQEAFVQACKTRPLKHSGPIAPFPISSSGSRRWPKNGYPNLPFSVSLAGIALAEEAGLPRLSLMCEVAASQLVSTSNVVEALSLCTSQKDVTGNDLPRLRKAAMEVVLRNGSRGVLELGRSLAFRRALVERRAVIVPTLLQGTMEAVMLHEKSSRGLKRDRQVMSDLTFEEIDSEDKYRRDRERKKRMIERIENDPTRQHELADYEMEDAYDEFRGWADESSRKSLKRMAKHLESMKVRSGSTSSSRVRYSVPSGTSRRSGSRRRSSGSHHQT